MGVGGIVFTHVGTALLNCLVDIRIISAVTWPHCQNDRILKVIPFAGIWVLMSYVEKNIID